MAKYNEKPWSGDPHPSPAFNNPWLRLMAAIVARAAQEAAAGDREAARWLTVEGEDGELYLEVLDIDIRAVRKWVNAGCTNHWAAPRQPKTTSLTDGDPIVEGLLLWLEKNPEKHSRPIRAGELYCELAELLYPGRKPPRDWPDSAREFGRRLQKIREALKAVLEIEWRSASWGVVYRLWPKGQEDRGDAPTKQKARKRKPASATKAGSLSRKASKGGDLKTWGMKNMSDGESQAVARAFLRKAIAEGDRESANVLSLNLLLLGAPLEVQPGDGARIRSFCQRVPDELMPADVRTALVKDLGG